MPTIRTTINPGVEIVVSDAEYEQLLDLGIIYDGTPPVEAVDPFDQRVAQRLADPGSATVAALRAAFGLGNDSAVQSLVERARYGLEPLSVLVVGDSTGDAWDEWVYLLTDWLGDQFPAYTTTYRKWLDTTQSYMTPGHVSVGTAGDAYLTLGAGKYLTTPDSAAVSVTGDLDVRVRVTLDDWTSTAGYFMSKYGPASGSRGWRFGITSTGFLAFDWSADGAAVLPQKLSTVDLAALANGTTRWLRVTHDVDNGSAGNTVTFYTSTDGETWTPLGAPLVTAGVTAHFDNTIALEAGSRTGGSEPMPAGRLFYAELRAGIDGPTVASFDVDSYAAGTTLPGGQGETWTLIGAPTVTGGKGIAVRNACQGGTSLSYAADPTRFGKIAAVRPDLLVIAYGHNEGASVDYFATYAAFIAQARAKWPGVGILCIAQNPRKAPATNIDAHAIRQRQVAQLARVQGHDLADVYAAFVAAGPPEAWIDADGIHPTAIGQSVWLDVVKALFTPHLST